MRTEQDIQALQARGLEMRIENFSRYVKMLAVQILPYLNYHRALMTQAQVKILEDGLGLNNQWAMMSPQEKRNNIFEYEQKCGSLKKAFFAMKKTDEKKYYSDDDTVNDNDSDSDSDNDSDNDKANRDTSLVDNLADNLTMMIVNNEDSEEKESYISFTMYDRQKTKKQKQEETSPKQYTGVKRDSSHF